MTNEKPRTFKWFPVMVLVSIFQAICSLTVLTKTNEFSYTLMLLLVGYMAVEWIYLFTARIFFGLRHLEIEVLGFFLSGIGLTVCASVSEDYALKQGGAILLGLRGVVLIGHGATSVEAVKNGTLAAAEAVRAGLVENVANSMDGIVL